MYFIEIFQAFTGRLPEVDDLIANIAGFLVRTRISRTL